MQIKVLKIGNPEATAIFPEGTTFGEAIDQLGQANEFSGSYKKYLNNQAVSENTVLQNGQTITFAPKVEGGRF